MKYNPGMKEPVMSIYIYMFIPTKWQQTPPSNLVYIDALDAGWTNAIPTGVNVASSCLKPLNAIRRIRRRGPLLIARKEERPYIYGLEAECKFARNLCAIIFPFISGCFLWLFSHHDFSLCLISFETVNRSGFWRVWKPGELLMMLLMMIIATIYR